MVISAKRPPRNDCKAHPHVQGVNQKLTQVLESSDADSSSVAATAQMLRALGVSAKSMRSSLLAGRSADLRGLLADAEQRIDQLSIQQDTGGCTLAAFVKEVSASFLPRLSQVRLQPSRHIWCHCERAVHYLI
jgi:hypothetical protein